MYKWRQLASDTPPVVCEREGSIYSRRTHVSADFTKGTITQERSRCTFCRRGGLGNVSKSNSNNKECKREECMGSKRDSGESPKG